MYRVGICDDNLMIVNDLNSYLISYFEQKYIEYDISCFTDPQKLLKNIDQLDIIFLDVEMPGIDGFAVAKEVRNKGNDIPIIFITSHKERVQEAFNVKAFRYLYKPVAKAELLNCIGEAIHELENKPHILVNSTIINMVDINYIESMGEGCAIHMNDKTIVSKSSLKNILEKLDDSFFQCHKSYAVNLRKIVAFHEKNVTLKNNAQVPVSTRKHSQVKTMFLNYISKHAKIL